MIETINEFESLSDDDKDKLLEYCNLSINDSQDITNVSQRNDVSKLIEFVNFYLHNIHESDDVVLKDKFKEIILKIIEKIKKEETP